MCLRGKEAQIVDVADFLYSESPAHPVVQAKTMLVCRLELDHAGSTSGYGCQVGLVNGFM